MQGNLIGTNAAGTAAIANASAGIRLVSDNNVIGGAGAANAIAFNNFDGVFVFGGTGNAIQANAIFSNAGLGISLTAGGNNNQTTPILSALSSSGGNTSIQGTLGSTPSQTFSIQFFANDSCDPSGAGEGQIFLGSTSVSTDANGKASFNVTLPGNVVASHSNRRK